MTTQVADALTYEQEHNPDGDVTYGVPTAPDCAELWPVEEAWPPSYTGIEDSHPTRLRSPESTDTSRTRQPMRSWTLGPRA